MTWMMIQNVEQTLARLQHMSHVHAGAEPQRDMLSIADSTVDSLFMWDPNNPDEVAGAKAHFDEAKKRGMLAYSVDPDTAGGGEAIRKFDPKAGKIILTKPRRR